MEPWATQELTGYSCWGFPSGNTWSRAFVRKDEIKTNTEPEIPWLTFVKTTSILNLLESLGYTSTTAWVASDLLKAIGILSYTTVRRSVVDREDLKPYWKSEKGPISRGDQQDYYLKVFQRLY